MTQSTVSPVSRKSRIMEPLDAAVTLKLFLKGIDNHILNVSVIVDDENVLRVAHHSFDPWYLPRGRTSAAYQS